MRTDKLIKVLINEVKGDEEESQRRLDDAFDLLFDEVMKFTEESNARATSTEAFGAYAVNQK